MAVQESPGLTELRHALEVIPDLLRMTPEEEAIFDRMTVCTRSGESRPFPDCSNNPR